MERHGYKFPSHRLKKAVAAHRSVKIQPFRRFIVTKETGFQLEISRFYINLSEYRFEKTAFHRLNHVK